MSVITHSIDITAIRVDRTLIYIYDTIEIYHNLALIKLNQICPEENSNRKEKKTNAY